MADAAPLPSTVTLYDQSGQPFEADPRDVASQIRGGARVYNDQAIQIRDADGSLKTLTGQEIVSHFTTPGVAPGVVETPHSIQQAREKAFYESTPVQTAAGVLGAARGVTGGLSDVAAIGAGAVFGEGETTRNFIQKAEEHNSGLSTAAEGLGFVGGVLASMGGTAAAKGALGLGKMALAAPTRALTAVGAVAERGAVRALEKVGIAEGSTALARAATTGARLAAEGATQGVASAVSEAVVQDTPITAESLAASGFVGAALGGALGAGGSLLASGARAGGAKAMGAAERALGLAPAAEAKTSSRVAGIVDSILPGAGRTPTPGISLEGLAVKEADRATLHASLASEPRIIALRAQGEGVTQRAVSQIESLPGIAGTKSLGVTGPAKLAEAAEKSLGAHEAKLASVVGEVDDAFLKAPGSSSVQAGAPAAIDGIGWASAIDKQAAKLGLDPAQDAVLGRALTELHALPPQAPISAAQAAIAPLRAHAPFAPLLPALEKLDDALAKTAQARLAGSGQATLAAKLSAATEDVAAARWLKDAAKEGAEAIKDGSTKAGSKSVLDLGTKLLALKSLGSVPGAIGGAATAMAVDWAKTNFGKQFIADVARRAVTSDAVRALEAALDGQLQTAARGFFTDALRTGSKAAGVGASSARRLGTSRASRSSVKESKARDTQAAYTKAVEAVRTASPASIQKATASVGRVSTPLAESTAGVAIRAQLFLASKVPGVPIMASPTPHLAPVIQDPGAAERRRFMAYYSAVTDPSSVIRDIEKGTVSPAQVEALREVYPALYGKVIEHFHTELSERKTPVSYEKRVSLSLILGTPLDPTLDPSFVAAIQGAHQSQGGQEQGPSGGQAAPPMRPMAHPPQRASRMSLDRGDGLSRPRRLSRFMAHRLRRR